MAVIDLNPNEEIIIETRQHWIFIFFGLVKFGLLLLLPFVVYAFLSNQQPGFLSEYFKLIWGGLWLYFFGISVFLTKFWIDYYLNVWVVTNQRVFDVELKGLFNFEVAVFTLGNIQDVTISIQGPLATLFNYGNVLVQTAGENMTFTFRQIAAPQRIQEQVVELSRQIRQTPLNNSN